MADATRKGLFFAVGLLAGGALAVWAYLTFFERPDPVAPVVLERPAPLPQAQPLAAGPPAGPRMAAAPPAGSCPSEPALAAAGPRDGQFSLQAALATSGNSDPASFLKVASEVHAAGRVRDAEVALIVACRVAERASGFQSAPLADAKVQLAEHYALQGARAQSVSQRRELLRRAETLLADSVKAYTAALGRNASKTQRADRQLTALAKIPVEPPPTLVEGSPGSAQPGEAGSGIPGMAQGVPPPSNPFLAQRDAPPSGTEDRSERSSAAAEPEQRRPRLLERSEPPPEVAERASDPQTLGAAAASAPERPVQRSSDLAQLDRDLQRLQAQARAVSEDPAGFERRQQAALAQREACGNDEACLRNWYAQRRRQLFSEF